MELRELLSFYCDDCLSEKIASANRSVLYAASLSRFVVEAVGTWGQALVVQKQIKKVVWLTLHVDGREQKGLAGT